LIAEIKNWIMSICTAVIFIAAVELILPNNNLKKYAKFVMGMILIAILINPIIKLYDKQFDMDTYVNNAVKYMDSRSYEKDFSKYKENSMANTMNTFKMNVEKLCVEKLKQQFPNNNYTVDAKVSYNNANDSVLIKGLKIGVRDGNIEKVKKVEVNTKGTEEATQALNTEKGQLIRNYISKELNISYESIEVYKN
jgi:stage III sporulation protein AF